MHTNRLMLQRFVIINILNLLSSCISLHLGHDPAHLCTPESLFLIDKFLNSYSTLWYPFLSLVPFMATYTLAKELIITAYSQS